MIRVGLMFYDFMIVCGAYFLVLWMRFDFIFSRIEQDFINGFVYTIPFYGIVCLIVFYRNRMYEIVWRFTSIGELIRTITLTTGLSAAYFLVMKILGFRMPASYYIVGSFLHMAFAQGIRYSYRILLYLQYKSGNKKSLVNTMIIGAGQAGQMICQDLMRGMAFEEKVKCFIDDNPNKWGRYIGDIPIVGGREEILKTVKEMQIKKIYFAIPSATPEQKRDILSICNETDCVIKTLPGLHFLSSDIVDTSNLKDVSVEDLLGRDPIEINTEEILNYVRGKVIMVTGGGGSIGSELCRQIAKHEPKQLIIFDMYENNAYDIQNELLRKYPDLNLVTLIGSVRDSKRLFQVFDLYRPEIVYHAAAHKHVPLMEVSPCEAIKNNAIGTYKTAFAAMTHGTKRFVLISTDKAVNPTNVMGATKRICEMVIQTFDKKIREGKAHELPLLCTSKYGDPETELSYSNTEFVAVRFGNVLGSNGSVIPLFKKQILEGGPLTVTHPDIIRYFMTIPEAVGLVLLAGTKAMGGEIFVLDMGEPVKIDTLARNLIRRSGLIPDKDIKIEYTGLRPGEKLFEEKLMSEEGLKKTDNDLIHIGKPIPFDSDLFIQQLEHIMDIAYSNDEEQIRSYIQDMVVTYHPSN